MKRKQRIWMRCGPPLYLLPEAIANSVDDLARMCGTTANSIRSYISHKKNQASGFVKNTERYVVVDIEEDEEE